MGVQIVHDKVPALGSGIGLYGMLDVMGEVFVAPTVTTGRSDAFPRGHVQVEDESQCAVTLIVEFSMLRLAGHAPLISRTGLTRRHGHSGMHPLQRLYSSHFIRADGPFSFTSSLYRLRVDIADISDLLLSLFVRYFGEPITDLMGFEVDFVEETSASGVRRYC